MGWRGLLGGRRGTPGPAAEVARPSGDREDQDRAGTALAALLAEIEADALAVYARHGLPTAPGHYRRAPDAPTWDHLGEAVDVERRWAMILERQNEPGWRFATLEDLGRFDDEAPEARAAAAILVACRALRERAGGRAWTDPGDDIERAIRLGADWRQLKAAFAWKEPSRLKLTRPDKAAGGARRGDAPAPRAARKGRKTAD